MAVGGLAGLSIPKSLGVFGGSIAAGSVVGMLTSPEQGKINAPAGIMVGTGLIGGAALTWPFQMPANARAGAGLIAAPLGLGYLLGHTIAQG